MSEHKQQMEDLISASKVAAIWNRRAKEAGYEGRYTRWSVRERRDDLNGVDTPLGWLYQRKRAEEINLRFGSPPRPDVANKNRSRKGKKQISESSENSSENT